MIGQKLAHYTITGKLGEGGMGVVYEAVDGHLDRAVALKLLPRDALADPRRKLRFVQEAKSASALNHPHIVTIYDINSDGGTDYIAMEVIRGRTLEQVLSRGKLRLSDVLKYGAQIADALAAAHAAGIVHRDLKPGNVMITERGDVKVLDFGLAKLTDTTDSSEEGETLTQQAVTDEGSVVGSAPYMSPEQAQGCKLDGRSDIFSFGSVMYEMLASKRAFRGANRASTMAAILKEEPEPLSKLLPDLPREVERVVMRCLRKDPQRRSQSMAEIRVALQDLKEESDSGSLPAPADAVPAARHRERWPYYYGAGGLLAAAAIATFWFLGPGQPAPPLQATVLTSFVGNQFAPSLSPDGNQFAFTWDGDVPRGPTHVYISLVGKGTPLRLTPENEAAIFPSWSPDGQSIAYNRVQTSGQEGELLVMPALGGPGRKIANTTLFVGASWSPDSKWLLWSERQQLGTTVIRVAPAGGGEARNLHDPHAVGVFAGDRDPALSPDGRQLVFSRQIATYDANLYLANFQDGRLTGAPRQLTHDHRTKWNPVWTNDGKEIIYIAGEATSELSMYRVRVSGGEPRRIEGIGANANYVTIARKSNRLLYSTLSINFDIRRLDLTSADAKPERFLSSTRYEGSPSYSPDGKRIAFTSNRGGVRQIWVADADANPTPLTTFAGGVAGSPKWSPDSQVIVFDARPGTNADVYTVPAGGGPVKQLTNDPGEDHVPSWSPNGKWIYFGSSRAGGTQVFRMQPDGSGVQQVTHNGGEYGQVSADGKWLYYSAPGKGLWKMPPDGGEATQVLPRSALVLPLNFVLTARGIYAFGIRQPQGFPAVFYPLDGGEPHPITTVSRAPHNFPAVSPDGRWFLYTTAEDPTREIMLVENFR